MTLSRRGLPDDRMARAAVALIGFDGAAQERARYAAALASLVDVRAAASLDEADAVVVCGDAATVSSALGAAEQRGIPVLVHEPAVFVGAEALAHLAAEWSVTGAPDREHPAVLAARAALGSGQLGLVHAVHADLSVPRAEAAPANGAPVAGGPGLLTRVLGVVQSLIGPLSGRAHLSHATLDPSEAACWALTMRLTPDVIVTSVIAEAPAGARPAFRIRLMGSHGQYLLDLNGPALQVDSGARQPVAFGPDATELLVRRLLAAPPGGDPGARASELQLARLVARLVSARADSVVTIGPVR